MMKENINSDLNADCSPEANLYLIYAFAFHQFIAPQSFAFAGQEAHVDQLLQ